MTFSRKGEEERKKTRKRKSFSGNLEKDKEGRKEIPSTSFGASTDPDFKVKRIIKRWLFDAEEHFGASPFDPTSLLKRYISGFLQLGIADFFLLPYLALTLVRR